MIPEKSGVAIAWSLRRFYIGDREPSREPFRHERMNPELGTTRTMGRRLSNLIIPAQANWWCSSNQCDMPKKQELRRSLTDVSCGLTSQSTNFPAALEAAKLMDQSRLFILWRVWLRAPRRASV